jgi:hypothetical protein
LESHYQEKDNENDGRPLECFEVFGRWAGGQVPFGFLLVH